MRPLAFVWRFVVYAIAAGLLAQYVLVGYHFLITLGFTPESPANLFLFLPLWPLAVFLYLLVTDPFGVLGYLIPITILGFIVIGGGIGAGLGYGVNLPVVRYIYHR
mgnify:CR=1 FL=1